MKTKKLNIKAFTVLEIAITLAIMGIISVMTYYIYTSMTQQFYVFQKTKITYFDYNLINSTIEEDVFNSINIDLMNENTLLFTFNNNEKLTYKVINNRLFRTYRDVKGEFDVSIHSFDFSQISNKIPRFSITYNLFEEPLVAVYYKNFGVSRSINKKHIK